MVAGSTEDANYAEHRSGKSDKMMSRAVCENIHIICNSRCCQHGEKPQPVTDHFKIKMKKKTSKETIPHQVDKISVEHESGN